MEKTFILPKDWEPYLMDEDSLMPDNDTYIAVRRFLSNICPPHTEEHISYLTEIYPKEISMRDFKEYTFEYKQL